MSAPRAYLSFVVFDDGHPADAIDALGMPQGEQWVVGLFAFALGDFLGNVVVHVLPQCCNYQHDCIRYTKN